MPKDFTHVAKLFAPDPPAWIAETLAKYAPDVHPEEDGEFTLTRQDYVEDVALILALEKVEADLTAVYLEPEYLDRLDDNTRDAFEYLELGIGPVLEYLKSQLGPPPTGRPRQIERRICAKLCADIWARCHDGKDQPWSTKLHDACQAYWVACGGVADNISWRNVLNGYD
jgi:hypothetical protein